MSTLMSAKQRALRAFRPTSARAIQVTCDEQFLIVTLEDGRVIQAPLVWFPRLRAAHATERQQCDIAGGGTSLHWATLDEDLTVANLLAGGDLEST